MAVALLTFILLWIRLPETQGRTFDDIAEEFRETEEIPLHNSTRFNTFNNWRISYKVLIEAWIKLLNSDAQLAHLFFCLSLCLSLQTQVFYHRDWKNKGFV